MYLLEGNIGVGKSTFLRLLNQHCPDVEVVPEPVENWASHNNGQSLLSNFYADPARWAYTIETLAMISRVKDHTREQEARNPYRVMERSVYSGHYCFALNDFEQGFFSSLEWEVYMRWVDFLVHKSCKAPRGFIYLRATPEVSYARTRKRNRLGEEGMSLSYITQIHEWHEKFLIEKLGISEHLKNIPVLVLDASQNLLENKSVLLDYIQQVRDFLGIDNHHNSLKEYSYEKKCITL